MGLRNSQYKIHLLAVMLATLTFGNAAQAQVPQLVPLNYEELRYDITLGNVPIGKIRLAIKEDHFGYSMQIRTKTTGLVKLFSPMHALAEARGVVPEEGSYRATQYESTDMENGAVKQHTLIEYTPKGTIKKRTREPVDDPSWRPVVPRTEANTAVDPVTGFLIMRQQLRDHMEVNQREVSLRTYEGARLAEFTFKVISRARVEVMDNYVPAINTVMSRRIINGYTPKEIKKFNEGDPTVHVYFSADERLIPLKITFSLYFGELTATLAKVK